jgi:L-histidine N-alpha-methyltransferase
MSHPEVEILLTPDDLRRVLHEDARTGLTSTPKSLPPKYFYDDLGSELFEQITALPEYYPTRTEQAILAAHAKEIAQQAEAEVLLELGSGSSEKTRLLLDAMTATGALHTYMPVDVSLGALESALPGLHQDYPDLEVRGVVADFDQHLDRLPAPGRRMVAFLGSTIGNYPVEDRASFLARIAGSLHPGESLLLGTDLVKSPDRLVAAYDDAAGVTADFNRNALRVLNRELGADFDPDRFDHVAVWDAEHEWMEMRLRAREHVTVHVPALDLEIEFAAGEEMRTEISSKFRQERVRTELAAAGLVLEGWWTDPAGDFALSLARK